MGPRAHAAGQRFRSVGLNCSYLTKECLEKMRFREGRIGPGEVLLPTHAVFVRRTEDFKRYVSSCARHEREPISFWMRRRGNSGVAECH